MARTVDLPIEGMTCGACAARIERGLGRLDGVASASVNLAALAVVALAAALALSPRLPGTSGSQPATPAAPTTVHLERP